MPKSVHPSRSVADQLSAFFSKHNVSFERDSAIGGVLPDFVVETSDGKRHVVETKSWSPTPSNVQRASAYAKLLANAAGVSKAYVVLENLKTGQATPGVVSPSGIEKLMSEGRAARKAPKREGQQKRGMQPRKGVIFAAMPFAAQYDDVFLVAIAGAAKKLKAVARRVDKEDFTGDIVAKVKERIQSAKALVVDLSESRPNVLYEMGYAQALEKPVIPISSSSRAELPFDVQGLNVLFYEKGQTSALLPKLASRLKATLTST